MQVVAYLEPDALPDAADRAIPALLTVRDLAERERGMRRSILIDVDGLHDQHVVAGDQHVVAGLHAVRDVELERQIPALMFANAAAVDPDCGVVVDRAEAQHDTPLRAKLAGLELKRSSVPAGAAAVAQVVELRLPGGRHTGPAPAHDLPDIGHRRSGMLELPDAVQREMGCVHRAPSGRARRKRRERHGRHGERHGRHGERGAAVLNGRRRD